MRLRLVPATDDLLRVALESDAELAAAMGVTLPASWPPEFYERETLLNAFVMGPEWGMRYFVADEEGAPVLVGFGGYKGPPDADGVVEVGYSVVSDRQNRGYATEAVGIMMLRAFQSNRVRRVVAETMPELLASIRVLEKSGFEPKGEASEPGAVRYERSGADYVYAVAVEAALQLPNVTEEVSFGTPTMRVGKSMLARLREDGVLVVKTGFAERDALIAERPETFSTNPHYTKHPYVLIDLDRISAPELAELLTDAGRRIAAAEEEEATKK